MTQWRITNTPINLLLEQTKKKKEEGIPGGEGESMSKTGVSPSKSTLGRTGSSPAPVMGGGGGEEKRGEGRR